MPLRTRFRLATLNRISVLRNISCQAFVTAVFRPPSLSPQDRWRTKARRYNVKCKEPTGTQGGGMNAMATSTAPPQYGPGLSRAQQIARDHHALHFAGAFVNC